MMSMTVELADPSFLATETLMEAIANVHTRQLEREEREERDMIRSL